jgi:hypothetical protein
MTFDAKAIQSEYLRNTDLKADVLDAMRAGRTPDSINLWLSAMMGYENWSLPSPTLSRQFANFLIVAHNLGDTILASETAAYEERWSFAAHQSR